MELHQLCDEQHERAPWTFQDGKFSTPEEAEYPTMFCKQLASCIFMHLTRTYDLPDPAERVAKLRASTFFACILTVAHVPHAPGQCAGATTGTEALPTVPSDKRNNLRTRGSRVLRTAKLSERVQKAILQSI